MSKRFFHTQDASFGNKFLLIVSKNQFFLTMPNSSGTLMKTNSLIKPLGLLIAFLYEVGSVTRIIETMLALAHHHSTGVVR
jgi:hypothetical protein